MAKLAWHKLAAEPYMQPVPLIASIVECPTIHEKHVRSWPGRWKLMGLTAALKLLADALDRLQRFAFWGLARVFGIRPEMPTYHHRAVREFLRRGCGPNRIGFFKAHHLHKEIVVVGCEAKIQCGLAFAYGLVPRLYARTMQSVAKAQLEEFRLIVAGQTTRGINIIDEPLGPGRIRELSHDQFHEITLATCQKIKSMIVALGHE
jgi:hypothetical protein